MRRLKDSPYVPRDYEPVFEDDFDDSEIDLSKWLAWANSYFNAPWCRQVNDLHDGRCYRLSDSQLHITVQPGDDGRTLIPAAICTQESAYFRPPFYAEIRARFPRVSDGAWASWWFNSKNLEQPKNRGEYTTEIDAYESESWTSNWAAANVTVGTIHKWHVDGLHENRSITGGRRWTDGQWHVYGYHITTSRLELTQDGIRCGYAQLADRFGTGDNQALLDPTYMLLDLWTRKEQNPERALTLDVDWVRVYKPTLEGTIMTLNLQNMTGGA